MKKLLQVLFSGWMLVLVGLLALAVAVWVAGPLVGIGQARPLESVTHRCLFIGTIVLVYALAKAWSAWRARRASAAVVKKLITPSPADVAEAGSSELATLQQRFEKALLTLKNARFAQRQGLWASASARLGKRYLYELPWYLIIGAPGSGKTTALLNSGLQFPLAASMGEAVVRGVGGTRHCDWWFTDEAVLIDTAGRYATQDSHREADSRAWSGFLDLLKESRPRQPINGVLVTVSVPDLLTRDASARAGYASAIRARVEELHERFGIRFPVYVMVTKCDLLAGFMEYFGDIGSDTRQSPWGFTFPVSTTQAEPVDLRTEFDRLHQRLLDGLIDRLQAEGDASRRARIYGFAQQFAGLRGVLDEFMRRTFAPSQFQQAPMVRGVYFVSGTQEGTPIDRMLGAISRTYGLARTPEQALKPTGKSYFTSRLLRELVFAEADLAGTSLKWDRRRRWLAAAAYAILAIVGVGALAAWGQSWLENRRYVDQVAADTDAVGQLLRDTPNRPSSDLLTLLPALAATQALATGEGASRGPGFGLDQQGKLVAATRQAYQRMLVDGLRPRLEMRVEEQLRGNFDHPELQYEALKTYVMLHDAGRFDAAALKLYITTDWELNLGRGVGTEQREVLEAHLDALLAQGGAVSPWPADAALVAQVRARLASMPFAQRVYARLRQEGVGQDIPEFTIAGAAGPNAGLVLARESGQPITRGVRGLYTHDGYHRAFQGAVARTTAQLHDEEGWVLGVASQAAVDPRRLVDDVRRVYLNDYAKLWEAFIGDIRLQPVRGLDQAVQAARVLSAPDNPLAPLLRALVRETTLAATAERSAVQQAGDKARNAIEQSREQLRRMLGGTSAGDAAPGAAPIESLVDDRFANLREFVKPGPGGAPAPLDGSIALVSEVYAVLTAAEAAMRGGNAPPPATPLDKVRAEAARLPEPLRGLLTSLSVSGGSAMNTADRARISSAVNTDFGEFCKRAIEGRYPFDPKGQTDVAQDDFARLFAPGGLLDDFFRKNLATRVDTRARPWTFRRDGNQAPGNSAALVEFERAAVIRDAFFRAGGTNPGFRLEFKPVDMDASITTFTLDVDGQIVKYRHDPPTLTPVQWPSAKGGTQVRVQLQPAQANGTSGLSAEGPWALFHLFDKLQVTPGAGPDRFNVLFAVDNRKAVFEVTASSVVNPFRLRELQQFRCPGAL